MEPTSHIGAPKDRENLLKAAPGGLDNGIFPLGGVLGAAREKEDLSRRLAP